jgi:hypothetical protein
MGARRQAMYAWAAAVAMSLAVGGCADGGSNSGTDVALQPAAPAARAATSGGGTGDGDPGAVPPGGEEVRHLGEPVTVTRTGPAIVDVGPRPAGATHLDLRFTCLSAGTFEFADGASSSCAAGEDVVGQARHAPGARLLALLHGEHATSVTTQPRSRWRLTATYATVRTTQWAVNDAGQTYGTENASGHPDLIGVWASNGRNGYAFWRELQEPSPTDPAEAQAWQNSPLVTVRIPVYETDGRTVVGEFLTQWRQAARAVAGQREPIAPMMATARPRQPVVP